MQKYPGVLDSSSAWVLIWTLGSPSPLRLFDSQVAEIQAENVPDAGVWFLSAPMPGRP